jgi:hypothetical protein
MPPGDLQQSTGMRARIVTGILAALVGLVWIGQGLGILRGSSFMVDDLRWALIGVVFVVAGIALAAWDRLQRR